MSTTIEKILRELGLNDKNLPTPAYIINQATLESNIDELYKAFNSRFRRFIFAYSYKTNYMTDVLRTVHRKGGYAEIVSPMELRHALKQVSGEKIIYNGVIPDNVTKYELAKSGGIVNIENLTELRAINDYAQSKDRIIEIGVRVNLNLKNAAASRFGIEMNDENLKEIAALRNVRVVGVHCHITKSRDIAFWREKAKQMAVIAKKIGATRYIDFGGNMYGKMHPDLAAQFHCDIPTFQDYADCIGDVLDSYFQTDDMPTVIVEAGTPIVANAQALLTSVIDIKKIRGKTICVLDAKQLDVSVIGDSGKRMPYSVLNFGGNRVQDASVYGCTCLEPDIFIESYTGSLNIGDWILFENIGAYSNVLAPAFIQGVPCALRCDSGGFKLIKRPDSYETIFGEYI